MIRRRSVLVDEHDRVRVPCWCPICRGPLVLKVQRFRLRADPKQTRKRDRFVCESCGITLRLEPWPKTGPTSNGWERVP